MYEYPTMIHYRDGGEVDDWLGTDSKVWAKDVPAWIEKQLTMMPHESLQPVTDKSHLLMGVVITAISASIGSLWIVLCGSDSLAPSRQPMKKLSFCNRRGNVAELRAEPTNLGVGRFLPVEWALPRQVQL